MGIFGVTASAAARRGMARRHLPMVTVAAKGGDAFNACSAVATRVGSSEDLLLALRVQQLATRQNAAVAGIGRRAGGATRRVAPSLRASALKRWLDGM
jgi:hypothetical protein